MTAPIRFEALSISVDAVPCAVAFYGRQLGFIIEISTPGFALLRNDKGTIGQMRTDLSSPTPEIRNRIESAS